MVINAVYEGGVFRPLGPVPLAEGQAVQIPVPSEVTPAPIQRLQPQPYPDDDYPETTDEDYEYNRVPPNVIGTITVHLVPGGELTPRPFPEED